MELRQENLVLLEQVEKQLRQLSIERLLVAIDFSQIIEVRVLVF